MKFGFCFFYIAIQCWWTIDCQNQTNQTCGDLEFSSSALITSFNCTVHFQCESTTSNNDCYKTIRYNKEYDLENAPKVMNCSDHLESVTSNRTRCEKEFSTSVYVWCLASQSANRLQKLIQLKVLDHLEKVQNMHKNDTDCILWTKPPNTSDIELEYSIKFMYYNGAIINSTTSDLTEYCLVDITFDECKLLSVSVVAKAVCGDASSNLTWWNGTILKPLEIPWSRFNVSLVMVENGVTIDISYTDKKTCPSVRALSAELSCWYDMKHNETYYSYQLTVIQHGEHVQLVHYNNKSVVLFPNEMAKCNLTLCNEAGRTEQWIEMFSTFPVQEFNISEVNKTHICMKYQFLNGSAFTADCRVTLNDTKKIQLNGSKSEECFNHSLPSGLYYYCVSCGGDCIMEGSVNVTNGGSTSGSHGINVIEAVTIPIGAGTLTVVVLLVVVVIVVIMIKVKRNGQYNLLKARSITYIITMCFTGIKQTTELPMIEPRTPDEVEYELPEPVQSRQDENGRNSLTTDRNYLPQPTDQICQHNEDAQAQQTAGLELSKGSSELQEPEEEKCTGGLSSAMASSNLQENEDSKTLTSDINKYTPADHLLKS